MRTISVARSIASYWSRVWADVIQVVAGRRSAAHSPTTVGRANLITFAGLTLMVVEEDRFIARYISSTAEAWGATVSGPFTSAMDALRHLQSGGVVTAAAISGDLPGGARMLTAELEARGVPCVYTYHHGRRPHPEAEHAPVLTQPYAAHQVLDEIVRLLER